MTAAVRNAQAFGKHFHEKQAQSYAELLERDTRPVPELVRSFGVEDVGPCEVPVRWYTDHSLYKAEIEKIWKRKWQMACRVDHVAEPGDTYLYEVGGLSFIIVRVSDTLIKGYWNSCLHRGVRIRPCSGRVDRLQCPFHGFTWSLEGRSILIPQPEEFPHIDPQTFSLPEVQVATWQGFVFINPDLGAQSLESYIGDLDAEFTRVPFTDRELSMHIFKIVPANWKVVQEAFMESYHVLTTHPQYAMSIAADRCNTFGASGNVSRGIVASGQTSDYVPRTPNEQDIFRAMNEYWDDEASPDDMILPEGMTARQAAAERGRIALRPLFGPSIDEASDAEMVDVFYYTLFPNFHPFGIYLTPPIYRFLPYGNDPDKCVMEVMVLVPVLDGADRQGPAKPIWLDADQEFTEIEALGSFGAFIAQDSDNLRGVMEGLRNSQTGIVNFARTHESKIRHFYSVYEEAMGLSAAAEVAALKRM
ncbi:MAG TPA: SRPBCC family protein [Allosphingosinicella sp.]|nr:SRPBCC family protein [Allosphingosinicella sp.]